jgi:orotidine-5'-phosphate decarboxylase
MTATPSTAKEKIIVAIDAPDADAAKRLADPLLGEGCLFKIGLQLFTAEGPSIVREFKKLGARVFLDLKFHDIPNTAKEAIHSAAALEVEMTTIHLCGGPRMVADSVAAADGCLQGLQGVVASPREILPLRENFGNDLVIVTPGVRPAGSDIGDQKRVMTPAEAVRAGANFLVIGRPITSAPSPVAALRAIAEEMAAATAG